MRQLLPVKKPSRQMDQQENKKIPTSSPVSLLRYTDIVFRMGMTIALGTWFGKWLDGRMNMTKPIYLPIFSLLGVAIAMYLVIRDANKLKDK
jgi:F0F1-type ATP synthase assembly protein I